MIENFPFEGNVVLDSATYQAFVKKQIVPLMIIAYRD